MNATSDATPCGKHGESTEGHSRRVEGRIIDVNLF